ncbi:MAG: GNAT family N-acetyltransferase, partial [Anaerolineae bacterium]|nr:GNAT family N-acetyltransferase [Anaerolineae bacterium]
MTYAPEIEAYWAAYLATLPEDSVPPATFLAWSFGLRPETADELGELVIQGLKTGTASLPEALEADGEPFPRPGDHHVILDGVGKPLCIIQTTCAYIAPFMEVDALHAFSEGEGDRALAYWRQVHRSFFGAECKRLGLVFHETLPVVCERFRMVYPELAIPVIRPLLPGESGRVDAERVIALVARVFNAFVAPAYAPEGVQTFFDYATVEGLRERSTQDHFVLVAEVGNKLAGMIEMRACTHVSLLFVDAEFQRRGIARQLLNGALAVARG